MQPQIHDEVFGLLEHDNSMPGYAESYETVIDFTPGEPIKLGIDSLNVKEEDLLALLQRAQATYLALQGKREDFLRAIADQFLSEYNLYATLGIKRSQEDFISHLKLESIHINQNGSSYLCYMPEGLEDYFGDHAVNIEVNSQQQVVSIE